MTTTAPIATNRQIHPIALYKLNVPSPSEVVIPVLGEWVNITDRLVPASQTVEIGFRRDVPFAGDDRITGLLAGPVRVRARVRVTGGVLTNATYLGLYVDGSFVDAVGAPVVVPLASIPEQRRDVALQDSSELLDVSWLVQNSRAPNDATAAPGTHYQVALASSVATSVFIINAEVEIERMSIAQLG